MQDRIEHGGVCVPLERQVARRHFVKDNPQREKVCPRIQVLPQGLFRRHIGYRSDNHARECQRQIDRSCLGRGHGHLRRLGQPEIEDLGLPPPREEDVVRLDIPVDDPSGVGDLQTLGHAQSHFEDLVQSQRFAKDALLERLAFEKLHGDEASPVLFVDVVDGANIRVIQGRSRLGFPLQTLQSLMVPGQLIRQKLQGDRALEPGVLRLEDHAHASAAELLQNSVVRRFFPCHGLLVFRRLSQTPESVNNVGVMRG